MTIKISTVIFGSSQNWWGKDHTTMYDEVLHLVDNALSLPSGVKKEHRLLLKTNTKTECMQNPKTKKEKHTQHKH